MMMKMARPLAAMIGAAVVLTAFSGAGQAAEAYVENIRADVVPQVRSWISNPVVIAAIKSQNEKHAGLTQSDIENMDKQWRSETSAGGGKLIDAVLGNSVSAYLGGIKNDGKGVYTEIFVMDSRGLNVGQSDVTSDYWQGDEAKWQKTYRRGADGLLIDEVEFDESTQTFQSQLSLSVVDPEDGAVIGAVTVGVNVDMLQ